MSVLSMPQLCEGYRSDFLHRSFKDLTRDLSGVTFFNPSFYFKDELRVFSFRTMSLDTLKLESHFVVNEKNQNKHVNLSALYCNFLNEKQLIDPKVFRIAEDLYITYNTGWAPEGNNIYVQKIYPEMNEPVKVFYDKRQKQERNWAFYSSGTDIFALYSLSPLKILKLHKTADSSWYFEDHYEDPKENAFSGNWSVGTQLSFFNEKYYFMAHRKHVIFGKKLYYGRLCSFCPKTHSLKVKPGLYFHSMSSLLGDSIRTNTNLFSCTYFSGIMALPNKLLLSYGINDVNYAFAELELRDF